MEVILLEAIEGIGGKGAVVQVRDGFARNYLLPYHRALPVNADTLHRLESLKKRFAEEEARLVARLKETAGGLEGRALAFLAKATPEGHLFGSISAAAIARRLQEEGYEVSDRGVRLPEPIKSVGTYPVKVHLHAAVSAHVTVVVEAEGGPPAETSGATPAAAQASPQEEQGAQG